MRKLYTLSLLISFLGIMPTYASDTDEGNTESSVSISGLPKEYVVEALWVNASGTTFEHAAKAYMATTQLYKIELDKTRKHLEKNSSFDYWKGRKLAITLSKDSFGAHGYNSNHGPNRAQVVIAALREKYAEKKDLTPEDLLGLYVSVWAKVHETECAQANKLMKSNETDRALAIMSTHSTRSDADVIGINLAMTGLDAGEAASIGEFVQGLSAHHFNLGHEPKKEETKEANRPEQFSKITDNMFKGMFK